MTALEAVRPTGGARRAWTLARVAWSAGKVRAASASHRDEAIRTLARTLAEARGLPLKVGQMLAGHEGTNAYGATITDVAPLPLSELVPVIEAELGQPVEAVFRSLEPRGLAASIGQVHRGVLLDGTVVAVKIQYPGIGDALDLELMLLDTLPALGPMRTFGFDVEGYKRGLREGIEAELDYTTEADAQTEYAARVRVPGLVVPRVIEATPRVLVQTWEDGVRLAEAREWPVEERQELADTLVDAFFRAMLHAQFVHADPNTGNLLVRRGPRGPEVVLLDYGATVRVSDARARGFRALVHAVRALAAGRPTPSFASLLGDLGFDSAKLAEISDALPALLTALLEPFAQPGPFDLAGWDLSPRIREALGEGRWWFRAAAPPDLYTLVRVLGGVTKQVAALGVDVDWSAAFDHAERGLPPLISAPAGPSEAPAALPEGAARWLYILIQTDGVQRVKVSLPARQVARLEELVPEHAHAHCRDAGLSLADIAATAIARGYAPSELLDWTDGHHRYHLWME